MKYCSKCGYRKGFFIIDPCKEAKRRLYNQRWEQLVRRRMKEVKADD